MAGSLALASATGGILVAQTASAAVPTFPDNLVVFPDRDFVTVEGYQDHVGQTATVEVWRDGVIVGSAQDVVEAGDVAFEINHPGGACWGDGTNLKVTPDIQPRDKVTIRFGTAASADDDTTTVADAMVTADSSLSGSTLTITGHIDGGLAQARTEQRIVNPALTDTDVARRDVRAVPGPLTRAARGGYSSGLEFPTADTFRATYVFDSAETAQIAATGGGERFMYWEVEDAAANRQGLTIAEYREAGGPGMGGCPPGPSGANAPAGTAQVTRPTATTAQVTWTPQTAVPGAAAVTGYSVVAIDGSVTPATQTGVRTDAAAKQVTLSGLTEGKSYTFEVRSIAGGAMSAPFNLGTAGSGGTQTPTAPANLTLSPAPNGATPVPTGLVTATGDSGGQIWYTTNGQPAYTDGSLAEGAVHYEAPLPVTAPVTLHFAYFNRDGNVDTKVGSYTPGASQAPPAAPTNLASTGLQQDRVTLGWTAVQGAAGYQVESSPGLPAAIASTTGTSQVITGLAPSTTYTFTVKAKNAEGTLGAVSNQVTVTTPRATDRVTISSARWKTGDFRVQGTGSVDNATIRVYRANADGSKGAQIGTLTATVTLSAYDWRLRTGVPTTNPGRIVVESSGGGLSAPFTVTNG